VIEQLHIADLRETDQLVEAGMRAELGGLASQRKQRQRGMLARRRPQERLVIGVEGEPDAGVGGDGKG